MGIRHLLVAAGLVPPAKVGAPNWDADHIIDGPLDLPAEATEPAAPAAGRGLFYAKSLVGRVRPKWKGPAGIDYPLQPHIGFNTIAKWHGGATTAIATTLAVIGSMSFTGAASSVQVPGPATTSILAQCLRSRILTAATAGAVCSLRAGTNRATRGNAASIGGFEFGMRFAPATMNAAQRLFMGMWSGTSNPGNVDWTTDTATARIGLVAAADTGNWRLAHNAAGAAPTLIDLGASFPINNTSLMELLLFCPPNTSSITYTVRNLSTGAEVTGTITTNLPANTLFLGPFAVMSNNTAAAAVSFDFVSAYLETDF